MNGNWMVGVTDVNTSEVESNLRSAIEDLRKAEGVDTWSKDVAAQHDVAIDVAKSIAESETVGKAPYRIAIHGSTKQPPEEPDLPPAPSQLSVSVYSEN